MTQTVPGARGLWAHTPPLGDDLQVQSAALRIPETTAPSTAHPQRAEQDRSSHISGFLFPARRDRIRYYTLVPPSNHLMVPQNVPAVFSFSCPLRWKKAALSCGFSQATATALNLTDS